jgi:branched-subunit amino acid aminotransferase/4-amino-4-deoxychorismate lyase
MTNRRARFGVIGTNGKQAFDHYCEEPRDTQRFQTDDFTPSCEYNSAAGGIKSCNYLEHLMSLDEAKRRGFHEAIRLNERGEVVSACMANLFWTKDGKLFTPSLRTGCLAGTTREYILENIECKEVEVGIDEINRADSIFLTSAGLGIARVREFDGKRLGRGSTRNREIIAVRRLDLFVRRTHQRTRASAFN